MEHKPVLMGFLNNGLHRRYEGNQLSKPDPRLNLFEVPEEYNVIVVCTSQKDEYIGYSLDHMLSIQNNYEEHEEYCEKVTKLTSEGRQVLFNFEDLYAACVADSHGDVDAKQFASSINNTLFNFAFTGVCLDFEGDIIDEKENQAFITEALKSAKDAKRKDGEDFFVCIAFDYYDLISNEECLSYLEELEGYYDLICVKFFSSRWVDVRFPVDKVDGRILTGNENIYANGISPYNDEDKEKLLDYIMNILVNGRDGFPKIPHDKLVMGLPANDLVPLNGYVKDPSAIFNVMEKLKQNGTPIRGLSAYSINWDEYKGGDGQPYYHEFIDRYKSVAKLV